MASRECINHPDSFCYVCGEFAIKKYQWAITSKIKTLYKLYFQCAVGEQEKTWAPYVCCVRCVSGLYTWSKSRRALPFAIPMIWREKNDCYFCAFLIKGISDKNRKQIIYPSL